MTDFINDDIMKTDLGNWTYLSMVMEIEPERFTEEYLKQLIQYEFKTKNRLYILDRLRAKHGKLRTNREKQELVDRHERIKTGNTAS